MYQHTGPCLVSVQQLPFTTFSKLPRSPLWCSEENTGLKLSNLESEIRAGEGYYLWLDTDWIGSRGSSIHKWQCGSNQGHIYLAWRSRERRANTQATVSVGRSDDEIHCSRAGGGSRETNKQKRQGLHLFLRSCDPNLWVGRRIDKASGGIIFSQVMGGLSGNRQQSSVSLSL